MTLIELLIVVAIAAVMAAVAIPSFGTFLSNSRFTTYSNTFLTHLHLARSEATKRNARVALCKSANGTNCATSGGWEQGWIVFHDVNNNAQTDTGEAILQSHAAIPALLALQGNPPVANYVSYAPTGGARLTNGAFQAGTLTLCEVSSGGGEARSIVVSSTGRARVQTVTVASCP
jgi:type IV fimbrial biogenesis protein FimT